jgi:hypothetical protein
MKNFLSLLCTIWNKYVTSKSPVAYNLEREDEEATEGKMNLRLVKINRTAALDALLGVIKRGEWRIQSSDLNEMYRAQMQSLKRVQKFTKDGELIYTWEKTGDENDHMHLATFAAQFCNCSSQSLIAFNVTKINDQSSKLLL